MISKQADLDDLDLWKRVYGQGEHIAPPDRQMQRMVQHIMWLEEQLKRQDVRVDMGRTFEKSLSEKVERQAAELNKKDTALAEWNKLNDHLVKGLLWIASWGHDSSRADKTNTLASAMQHVASRTLQSKPDE